MGGKAGAAAEKGPGPGIKEMTAQSSGDGDATATAPEVTSSTSTTTESKGGGSRGSKGGSKSDKTTELLHEATQLLKTLRVQPGNPKLNVMQISGLDRVEENMALIDSGANGLRPARDEDEWMPAERTHVQLASGFTDAFRLKHGTKILLGPTESPTVIVPMGGLNDLDYKVEWSNGICTVKDDLGRVANVTVINGCPMIPQAEGRQLLEWLELLQVHQLRKVVVVKALLADPAAVDKSQLDLELALTAKLRQTFPSLPDQVLMRLVPNLERIKTEGLGLVCLGIGEKGGDWHERKTS